MNEYFEFQKYLNIFEKLGYRLNEGVSYKEVYKQYASFLSSFEGLPQFAVIQLANHFSPVYLQLGNRLDNYQFVTDNCIWWDLEFFDNDGVTEYIDFMKRMGVISRGKLVFKNINCYKVQNGLDDRAIIEFEVNGIKKVWTILYGYTDIFIQRFANLCEELGTKGKYTIYDDGGQSFVLDYGTNEDIEKFKEATGLQRRFLKDTNHFNRPED